MFIRVLLVGFSLFRPGAARALTPLAKLLKVILLLFKVVNYS